MTEPPQRMSFGSSAALTAVLAFGLCFATVHAIPLATRLGVPQGFADNLPFLGFFAGSAVGVAAAFSRAARSSLGTVFAVIAFGFVTWLLGLLLEGALVVAGVDEERVSWVSPGAFWLGIAAGTLGLLVGALEALQKLVSGSGRAERGGDRNPPG